MSPAERDWVHVVAEETCDECGLRASSVPRDELGLAIEKEASLWVTMLGEADADSLCRHSQPGRWTALEYAAHVRDVLVIFKDRVILAMTGSNPDFGWWDHEAAAVADRYNEQDPSSVASELETAADALAALAAGIDDPAWSHTGTRRSSEVFTVEGLVRFALHETRHHRVDAQISLDAASAC